MIKCPANYFGRGEDFNLSDMTPEEMTQFNKEFEEWEKLHPDDPVGEKALEAYKSSQPSEETTRPIRSKPNLPENSYEDEEDAEDIAAGRLRLSLPVAAIERLKRYAKRNKRRPKDVIMTWILRYC